MLLILRTPGVESGNTGLSAIFQDAVLGKGYQWLCSSHQGHLRAAPIVTPSSVRVILLSIIASPRSILG